MRPAAAALLDLLVHRPGDNVARGEILQVGSVALHEALAIDVEKDAAFAAHTLGDQHARGVDAGRMELPHFHVFERDAGTCSHAQPVTRVDERVGARGKDSPCAAGREEGRLGLQDHHVAGFHFQRGHPQHVAVGVADQIERHPLDQESGARPDIALIERMQHRVPGAIGRRASALHRAFAEIHRVPAEWPLPDRAVRVAVERHAEMLELVDDAWRHLAHVLDGVLIAEPVRPLDGVVHVPEPAVFRHVAKRGANAALGRHGMRARRKNLRQDRDRKARLGELQRGPHSGAAGADNDGVELAHR